MPAIAAAHPECDKVRIGSRTSELAMIQTMQVRNELATLLLNDVTAKTEFDIITKTTTGDVILDTALSKIGSKSLFTKELEMSLESREVDLVVHSCKDLPTSLPAGLVIGAILKREDPRDAVVMSAEHRTVYQHMQDLPSGSIVGTSSVRRCAQLRRHYPHLQFETIRGNLNTRIRKLDDSATDYKAIVLAAAGLHRMGWSGRISHPIDSTVCLHAVAQGALAIECRADDWKTLRRINSLTDEQTSLAVVAERALMAHLQGGCSAPVAAHGEVDANLTTLTLTAGVWTLDGQTELRDMLSVELQAEPDLIDPQASLLILPSDGANTSHLDRLKSLLPSAVKAGIALGRRLEANGARSILDEARLTSH